MYRVTGLTQQNKASTNWANGPVPAMPGYGDPYDKPFAEMYTPEDQVHWLYVHLMGNPQKEDYSDLQSQIDDLKKRVDELEKWRNDITASVGELARQVSAVASGAYAYDVTSGDFAPTMTAARRTWQGANIWGMTVEDAAPYTCGEAAAWLVGEAACSGKWSIMGPAQMEGREAYAIQRQIGRTYPEFNPADYIRRDELERVEVDNLQDGTIYGVPQGGLPTPVPPAAPYIRPATVGDYRNSQVTWQEHFVTDDLNRR